MLRCIALVVLLTGLLAAPAAAHEASPSASPDPEIQIESLITYTVPAEVLPAGEWSVGVGTIEISSDSVDSTYGGDTADGTQAVLITSGTYGVTAEGPLVVFRGPDGAIEEITPGNEVVLEAGDLLIYPDKSVHRSRRTIGGEPVTSVRIYIEGPIYPGGGIATPAIGSNVANNLNQLFLDETAQAAAGIGLGPVTLTLRRVTLAPGALTPPLVDDAYVMRVVAEGKAGWSLVPSGEGTPDALAGPTEGSAFKGMTLPWATADAGHALIIENAAEAPLVLYEATIAPAGPDDVPIPTG